MIFYHISPMQRDNHKGGGKEKLKNKKPTFPLPCVFPSALPFPHPTPLSAFYFVCRTVLREVSLCVLLFIVSCESLCVQTKNEERDRGQERESREENWGKGRYSFLRRFSFSLSPGFPLWRLRYVTENKITASQQNHCIKHDFQKTPKNANSRVLFFVFLVNYGFNVDIVINDISYAVHNKRRL